MIDIRKNIVSFLNTQFSKNDVKQIDLANYLNVSKVTIFHWTKGVNAPDINLLPGIAEFFGVSISEVLGVGELEEISIKERKVLKAYRDSSPEVKEIIERVLNIK